IGGYEPWIASHANPEQAWAMADHLRADHLLPMHHSTFRLSYEPVTEPIQRLMETAGRLVDPIVAPEVGMAWGAGAWFDRANPNVLPFTSPLPIVIRYGDPEG